MKLPLSLVIITKNEEEHVARCISSVPMASEVIVVDSHSSDRTVQIAKELGAKVFIRDWPGYGAQKKWATEQATFPWVLSLDADECLSSELQAELPSILQKVKDPQGVRFPRLSFHLGRWIRYGGWYPDYQMRLFNKAYSQWDGEALHEKVTVTSLITAVAPIHHYVFDDLSDQVVTNDRYSGLGAQELLRKGKKFNLFHLITKPWVKFFECYIFKRGFLDGLPGFLIAVSAGYSVFLKWGKLWELQKKQS